MISRSSKNPICTVVIACFGRQQLLEAAVQSVVDQDYRPIEVIVIDDGSDPPLDVQPLHALENEQMDIRIVRLNINQGPSFARNIGIEAANGLYVTFLDSDDRFCPRKISSQISEIKSAHADFCICGFSVCSRSSDIFPEFHPKKNITMWDILCFDTGSTIPGPCLLYRTHALRGVGGFDPKMWAIEEYDLIVRLMLAGCCLVVQQQAMVQMNVDPELGHLSHDLEKQTKGRIRFIDKHRNVFYANSYAYGKNLQKIGIIYSRMAKKRKSFKYLLFSIKYAPSEFKTWAYFILSIIPFSRFIYNIVLYLKRSV